MGAHAATIDERIPEDTMDTTTTPQPDPALTDEVLTTEAAARFLKISLRTLQTMVRQGNCIHDGLEQRDASGASCGGIARAAADQSASATSAPTGDAAARG